MNNEYRVGFGEMIYWFFLIGGEKIFYVIRSGMNTIESLEDSFIVCYFFSNLLILVNLFFFFGILMSLVGWFLKF